MAESQKKCKGRHARFENFPRARSISLVEELAAVVLLGELLLRHEAWLPGADVLLEPRLAVVRLEPSDATLLLQRVAARPCGETAEQLRVQPRGLVHVVGLPALVSVASCPILVLLDLLGVCEALGS